MQPEYDLKYKSQDLAVAMMHKRKLGDNKITLYQLSEMLGVGYETICRMERGNNVEALPIAKVCKWLGQPMEKYFV